MKSASGTLLILTLLLMVSCLSFGQGSGADLVTCSPPSCVFPPIQASEGGAEVTDTPIVTDPLNPLHVLLGSTDFNCPPNIISGFHISLDGGSSWTRYCMPSLNVSQRTYDPGGQPMVGYDRDGTAYIASEYGDSEGLGYGLIALQKSADGSGWSSPAIALDDGYSLPLWASMTVDTNATSPYLHSLYVAAVIVGEPQQARNRVVVTHSRDGGVSWQQASVAPVQVSPDLDRYTSMSTGKDGTLYLTWVYCNLGPFFCDDDQKAYIVFSKSSDGGNAWSQPVVIARLNLGNGGPPNTDVGADDYPAIAVTTVTGLTPGTSMW